MHLVRAAPQKDRDAIRASQAHSHTRPFTFTRPNPARLTRSSSQPPMNLRMGNDGKLADGRKGIRSGGPSLTRQ